MFEFEAKDITVGDEFTVDEGKSWWRARKVEPRSGDRVWIEASDLNTKSSAVSSETYAATDTFVVR